MIKNEKGITLVVLAITIIVMTILATVVTYSALDSLRTAQKNAFISEMEMVQAKVNVIYEKMQNNTQDIEYYNSLGQDVSVLGEETLIKILGDSSRDGFKYFSKEDLKNLELEDINQEVIINFSTREVISTRGIKIGGVMYYKLSNIPNYKGHNIDYINKNTEAPTFEVEQTKLESGWKFTIKNIKYNSNVEGGTLSYKLHNDTNWIIAGQDTSFIATKPGIYDIKFTDKAGNSAEVQRQVYVEDGMLAYYDGENNTGNGHSDTTIVWKDLSGNGNDGLLSNINNDETSGWKEKELLLDGDDDEVSMPVEIAEGTSMTIEVVFTEHNFENYAILRGVGKNDETLGWHGFLAHTWYDENNIYDGSLYIGGGKDTSVIYRFNSAELDYKTTIDKTDSLVYTFDYSTKNAQVYVNGEKLAEKTYQTNPDSIVQFEINNSQKSYHRVSMYNRVLTEEEIKTNYEIDKFRFGITE